MTPELKRKLIEIYRANEPSPDDCVNTALRGCALWVSYLKASGTSYVMATLSEIDVSFAIGKFQSYDDALQAAYMVSEYDWNDLLMRFVSSEATGGDMRFIRGSMEVFASFPSFDSPNTPTVAERLDLPI